MVVNKRKKNSRQRASTTHGYGSKKKHRGHGSRGGSGLGGTGKRADSKKPSFWNEPYFGKYGFKRNVTVKPVNTLSILELESKLDSYLSDKLIAKEGDFYVVDLDKLGSQKILGNGKVTHKFRLTAKFASGIAIEKVKAAGGEVIVTIAKKEKKKKPEADAKKAKKTAGSEDSEE
jgi:large subunit ribosomal protein L15